MSDFHGDVLIEDEFLRDELQNEKRLVSIDEKLRFLLALEDAGVWRIQVGSFVNPKRVPQMADTDALFDRIERKPGTKQSHGEKVVKDIRRATRKQYSEEEKIRVVLDGLMREDSIAELSRREGFAQSLY